MENIFEKFFAFFDKEERNDNIRKASFQSPNSTVQSFEDSPVLFGQLVVDRKIRNDAIKIFATNDEDEIESAGFTQMMYTYHYEEALLSLKEYVELNLSSLGGILTQKDLRGAKYLVYVQNNDSRPEEYQVSPNNPHV